MAMSASPEDVGAAGADADLSDIRGDGAARGITARDRAGLLDGGGGLLDCDGGGLLATLLPKGVGACVSLLVVDDVGVPCVPVVLSAVWPDLGVGIAPALCCADARSVDDESSSR